ncbi:uncharacterized protein A4U43_C08F4430 [Asparagus officinalis]|nr:uncharacterized protein A4U43_C08F4430 [Asparagus officinalis]
MDSNPYAYTTISSAPPKKRSGVGTNVRNPAPALQRVRKAGRGRPLVSARLRERPSATAVQDHALGDLPTAEMAAGATTSPRGPAVAATACPELRRLGVAAARRFVAAQPLRISRAAAAAARTDVQAAECQSPSVQLCHRGRQPLRARAREAAVGIKRVAVGRRWTVREGCLLGCIAAPSPLAFQWCGGHACEDAEGAVDVSLWSYSI